MDEVTPQAYATMALRATAEVWPVSTQGEDDMDAAGTVVALRKVADALDMSFYRSLAAGGGVDFSEFASTSQNLIGAVETLEATPPAKLEAPVAEFNDELTEQLAIFNAVGQQNFLSRFRAAQILSGYSRTIITRAGVRGRG